QSEPAIQAYTQALTIWQDTGNIAQQANTLSNIGALHLATAKYAESFQAYEDALTLAHSLKDLPLEAKIL
ncbi:MAG: tetratricopeptide repeat protein, partial [Caldilineaceae bacterium]|nr:tetratricopeptide repeat protein [Caldilineaceae bacterium]